MQTLDGYGKNHSKHTVRRYIKDSFANTISAYLRAIIDYDTACESFEKLGSKFMVKHTNKAGAEKVQRQLALNSFYFTLYALSTK